MLFTLEASSELLLTSVSSIAFAGYVVSCYESIGDPDIYRVEFSKLSWPGGVFSVSEDLPASI